MSRVLLPAILLLVVGVWVHPLLTRPRPAASAETNPINAKSEGTNPIAANALAGGTATTSQVEFTVTLGREGFWRIGRTTAGVWWFIAPDGKLEFLNTITSVQPTQPGRDESGPAFVSRDLDGDPNDPAALDRWAAKTLVRIQQTGFKGLGAWCNHAFHKLDVPVTRDLNLSAWVKPEDRRLYSAGWVERVEHAVVTQVQPLCDNRNLVGYYLDNELDWTEAGAGPGHYFNGLSPDDPNRKQVVAAIKRLWPTVEAFNQDWMTQLADWSALDSWPSIPNDRTEPYARLFSHWLESLARDYFRITTELVRKHDPNHLILGVRFRGFAPREVVRASRGLTDAQSLNYYVCDAKLDGEMFRMMSEESDQPLIVTEYSFHALDGRSGNRNTVGFAAQVLDQQARADGYRLYTTRLARVPYVIGADWFQWSDEPPSGRRSDGEDVNFGIVDIDDNPYEMLVNAVRQTSPVLNDLHAASWQGVSSDVWREDFLAKPAMTAPRLARNLVLNGELSDWPADSKLSGVRHSQSIGLERSTLPVPNVFAGWQDDGLYLAFEVFDRDIQGAPAKGWWWTRDHVEFWISTRPVGSNQDLYDPYCHQFFFVPIDFPGDDGVSGVVGQWHRAGDALSDHLIPHPQVRSAVRVLPNRYVVEMFIPGTALHGWDPNAQPVMSFNFHARNFQHAIDYFWSAPKEVTTQLRPSTWGTLKLDRR